MKQGKNHSEKRAWNPIIVLVLFLCAIFGIVSLTYSWLTQSTTAVPTSEGNYSLVSAYIDDFSYALQYSFNGTDWLDYSVNNQDNWLRGIAVDYADSSADNYIGNLHFRVKQTGSVKSALRVRFDYQWFKTETTTGEDGMNQRAVQGPVLTLTPTFGSDNPWSTKWSHASGDRYYYYLDGSSYVFPKNQDVSIADGLSLASVPSNNDQLRVIVTVDGVQFNRYREVWEVSSVPSGS